MLMIMILTIKITNETALYERSTFHSDASARGTFSTSFPGLFPLKLRRPSQFPREKPWERGWVLFKGHKAFLVPASLPGPSP